MPFRLVFKSVVSQYFLWLVMSFGLPFGHIQESGSENASKKCPARFKHLPIQMAGGSWRGRLACALLKQGATVRRHDALRICSHCFFQFELASIAHAPNKIRRKWNWWVSTAHCWWSDTPLSKAWRICGSCLDNPWVIDGFPMGTPGPIVYR